MENKELIEFIENSLARNVSIEETKKILLENKWQEKDIEDAIAFVNAKKNPKPPAESSEKPAGSDNPFANFKLDEPVTNKSSEPNAQPKPEATTNKQPSDKPPLQPLKPVSALPLSQPQAKPPLQPSAKQPFMPPAQPSAHPFADFNAKPKFPALPSSGNGIPPGFNPMAKKPEKPQAKKKSMMMLVVVFGILAVVAAIFLAVFFLAGSGKISDEEFIAGANVNLKPGKQATFNFNGLEYSLTLNFVQGNFADITAQNNPNSRISTGEIKKFNLNSDGFYDVMVSLNFISEDGANFNIKQINERICTESWECTDWGDCLDSLQTRICTDINSCGTEISKPEESQECEAPPTCAELNGTICTTSQICNGTNQTASDGTCCSGACEEIVGEEILLPCLELNGTICETNQTCVGEAKNSSDEGICCAGECE